MVTLNDEQFDEEFIALYKEYKDFIVKYLSTVVYDCNCAEDLAQDIFVRIYKNGNIPPEGSVFRRNYMLKSARNMAIDYLRKKKKDELKMDKVLPELSGNCKRMNNDVYNTVMRNFVASRVNEVLNEFPEKNKRIFIDRLIDNKKMYEISDREELSKYRIRQIELEIISRLRLKMKEFID